MDQNVDPANGSTQPPVTPPAKPEGVPLAALEAERAKRQAAETELATLRKAAADAEAAEAAKRGEFQKLHEQATAKLTAAETELATLREAESKRLAAVKARNAERVTALPEDARGLVPDGLAEDALAAWLDKATPKLAGGTERPAGTRARPGGAPEIPAACIAEAAKHGKQAAWWFENVWSKRKPKTS